MELTTVATNAAVIAVATLWVTWHARGRFNDLKEAIHGVDRRIDRLEQRFEARSVGLEERSEARFLGLEERSEARFLGLERTLSERITALHGSVDGLRSDLTHFVGRIPPRAENA